MLVSKKVTYQGLWLLLTALCLVLIPKFCSAEYPPCPTINSPPLPVAEGTLLSPTSTADFMGRVAFLGDIDGNGGDEYLVGHFLDSDAELVFTDPAGVPLNIVTHTSTDFFHASATYFSDAIVPYRDVDGDGNTEVLVSSAFSRFLALVSFNTDGSVKSKTRLLPRLSGTVYNNFNPVGDPFRSLTPGFSVTVIGDVDGNGAPDLAVSDANLSDQSGLSPREAAGSVDVLLMNTDGTLIAQQGIDIGNRKWAVKGFAMTAPGDMDNDGIPDLLVSSAGAEEIELFLLNQNGSIKQKVQIPQREVLPEFPFTNQIFGARIETIDDLNGDGTSELLIVSTPRDSSTVENAYLTIAYLQSDLNDIVLESRTCKIAPEVIANGAEATYGVGIELIPDRDSDGIEDLFTAIRLNSPVSGTGQQWFTGLISPGALHRLTDECPEDLEKTESGQCGCGTSEVDSDSDGVPDCVDVCSGHDDSVDSDNDGSPDGCDQCPLNGLKQSNSNGGCDRPTASSFYCPELQQYSGVFEESSVHQQLTSDPRFGRAMTSLGDIDSDGNDDLVFGGDEAFYVAFMNSDGTIRELITHESSQFQVSDATRLGFGVALARYPDLDSDGIDELYLTAGLSRSVFLIRFNADGSVKQYQEIKHAPTDTIPLGRDLTLLGDMDGDMIDDLGVMSYSGAIVLIDIYFINADGTLKSQQRISTSSISGASVVAPGALAATGDPDGNGTINVVYSVPFSNSVGSSHGRLKFRTASSFDHKEVHSDSILGSQLDRRLIGVDLESVEDLNQDGIRDLIIRSVIHEEETTETGIQEKMRHMLTVAFLSTSETSPIITTRTCQIRSLGNLPLNTATLTTVSDLDGDGVDDLVLGNDPVQGGASLTGISTAYIGRDYDACPEDPNKTAPGLCGCGEDDGLDADDDGVPNCNDICALGSDLLDADDDGTPDACDQCPDDGAKVIPGTCGCGVTDDGDDDGDGVPNCQDICSLGDDADDSDGDGTPNSCDECPNNASFSIAPVGGCNPQVTPPPTTPPPTTPPTEPTPPSGNPGIEPPVNETPPVQDTDGDGVPDDSDLCPGGRDDMDRDGDAVPDVCDVCPDNANEQPTICGCGIPETDVNGDGVIDCTVRNEVEEVFEVIESDEPADKATLIKTVKSLVKVLRKSGTNLESIKSKGAARKRAKQLKKIQKKLKKAKPKALARLQKKLRKLIGKLL